MTLNARQIPLKLLTATAALLLASAIVSAQQATPPQGNSNAAKKHPAGVKYNSMTTKSADPSSPTAQPQPAAPQQVVKRKNGAINAADFNKQASVPNNGGSSTPQAQGDHVSNTTAGKGIGSAGIPGKAASAEDKAHKTPAKSTSNTPDASKK